VSRPSSRSASAASAPPGNLHETGERNDALDGLRALAVAAVMAFHLRLPGATAGFLGVDVFFVLSGYLITRILLSGVRAGRLDPVGFWVRRIRRLAPALVVCVAAVIMWGAVAASAVVRDGLRADITSTLAYVANWHFINSSGYFSATGDPSPLQHMWSLAVEEQFYLVWPIVLLAVTRVVRPAATRTLAVGCLALCGLVSSAWRLESLWNTSGPDRAYMGTDSRMFGPLVGALLAAVLMRRAGLGGGRKANAFLLAAGGAFVLWGLISLGSPAGATRAYATGGALVVALGTAGIIWALATRTSTASRALGLLPVAYLGRLSYGIYIWHWPLIVWAEPHQMLDMSSWPTVLRDVILTGAAVALASLSYHVIEKPIRYGKIAAHLGRRRTLVVLPVALGLLVAANSQFVVPRAGAVVGNVTRTIVLVGDSVPQRLASEFSRAAAASGYVVVSATRGGCPATGVMVVNYAGRPTGEGTSCPRLVPSRQDYEIRRFRPALVIWWSRYEVADRLAPGGSRLTVGTAPYWRAQESSFSTRIAALTKLGAQVVAVQIERSGIGMLTRCTATNCGPLLRRLIDRTDLQDTWNAFLAAHHGPAVHSISINRFVCHDNASPCNDTLPNGSPARPDGTHYSPAAAAAVVRRILAEAFDVTGLKSHAR
jgi:peptidoglycan/LPS O-acetylase OafA/YrhL